MKRTLIRLILLIGLLNGTHARNSTRTQATIEFRNATIESDFPNGITFRIEICGRSKLSSAVFNYSVSPENSQTWTWTDKIWTLDEGQTPDNCDKRKFYLETKDLDIPPFAPVRYYWTVTENSAIQAKSSIYLYYYRDASHDWQTLQNKDFVVWWHDRPISFGEQVLSVASTANQQQSEFYGYALNSPIIIVITNSSEEFFAWQSEQDDIDGVTYSDLSLTIHLLEETAGYQDWLDDAIPHAISHIYFDHLVEGYSGAPYWLEDGLATYQEYNDHNYEWRQVRDAVENKHILLLKELEYSFGEDDERIHLATAQSYYAVLYMEEFYGPQSVSILLAEFRNGSGEDAAFEKAFGQNTANFEKDYVSWLEKRIQTAPPDTSRHQPLSAAASNWLFVILVLLCSTPIWFVAIGAGLIAVLWKLNIRFSKQVIKPIP